MSKFNTVAIVGVGLIGGSIGLALKKKRLARRIVGVGRRAASLRKARELKTVDATSTSIARGVSEAELIVVCTPVDQIADHVRQAAEACPAGALITDAGSIKGQIIDALPTELDRGVSFVGSHPMAGSEKTGPSHARDDLFQDRAVIVTPNSNTLKSACERIVRFWRALGARVTQMPPAEHDAAVAAISHLPHVLASALAGNTPTDLLPLAAGGWRDTTRVAGGDVELWTQILSGNRACILMELDKFAKVLASWQAGLEKNDRKSIAKLLQTGKQHRDALGS